jgi:hypothetical protein
MSCLSRIIDVPFGLLIIFLDKLGYPIFGVLYLYSIHSKYEPACGRIIFKKSYIERNLPNQTDENTGDPRDQTYVCPCGGSHGS